MEKLSNFSALKSVSVIAILFRRQGASIQSAATAADTLSAASIASTTEVLQNRNCTI